MGSFSSGATLTIMLLPLGRLRLALLDDLEAPLDDGQRLHEIAFEANEDVGGVLVGAAHRLARLRLCAIEEFLCLHLGLPQDRLVLQEKRRLFLRGADDLLGFFARLRKHAVALLVDAPRLPHLFGYGDAELVDDVEDRRLLEDDLARHGDFACVDDERFEAFHEELNVQRHPPPPPPSYRSNRSASSALS